MKTHWETNEWCVHIPQYVSLSRRRYSHLWRLNEHDWDDIEQEARIRVWEQRDKADPTMPIQPWVRTVVARSVSNSVRTRFSVGGARKKKTREWRWHFRYPQRLMRWTSETDHWDEEHWVREDDIVDYTTDWRETPPAALLTPLLTSQERLFMQLATRGESTFAIGGIMGLKSRHKAYAIRNRIRAKWLGLCDAPVDAEAT